jgi:microsomal dipeptidase-like Zn-dependent dipeptidase
MASNISPTPAMLVMGTDSTAAAASSPSKPGWSTSVAPARNAAHAKSKPPSPQTGSIASAVRGFVDALGADRVHFGTDDPVFDPVHSKEDWIEHVAGLADRESAPEFTQAEVDAIMGEGAAALLDD